jgi:hypothetical protein
MARTHPIKIVIAIFMSLVLAACAASPQQFAAKGSSMGDTRVCKTWISANKGSDAAFHQATTAEIDRRGLSLEQCKQLITQQRIVIGAAIVLTAVVVAAAKSGGGGGGGSSTANSATDSEWDWDQFQNQYGQRVTQCRGVQTGQFAENWHCSGKLQNDLRWPGPYVQ